MKTPINKDSLEKAGFQLIEESKLATRFINEHKTLAIQVKDDRTVWLSVDGFKAKTTISTMEGIDNLVKVFENEQIELPF